MDERGESIARAARRRHFAPFLPILLYSDLGIICVVGAPFVIKLFVSAVIGSNTEDLESHVLADCCVVVWDITAWHIAAGIVIWHIGILFAAAVRWIKWKMRLHYGGIEHHRLPEAPIDVNVENE